MFKLIQNLTCYSFHSVLSIALIIGLHGSHSVFPLTLSLTSFLLSKLLAGSKLFFSFIWIFNIITMLANEYFNGYSFRMLDVNLSYLDLYKGLMRWHVFYRFTMLRNISFGLDLHWSKFSHSISIKPSHKLDQSERKCLNLQENDYNLSNFVNYAFYPPLYIAGPIMTFNDFVHQKLKHCNPIKNDYIFKYALRFAFSYLTLEVILHYMYVIAIKNTGAWRNNTPAELALIGFWNLIIVWLKLLIPWRFFRLWSLCDGIDCPENMIRCVANNYSTTGFWRAWHRSFNLWIIR